MAKQALHETGKHRVIYFDILRILAAFGVIVNHTNSEVFQSLTPQSLTWYLSLIWYYLSKLAVPLFVMVSGACLLPKQDSYRNAAKRFARVAGALLLFSYGYYLYDAWVYHGLWPRAIQLDAFFPLIWGAQITDSFWYLYMYLGLIVMLPLMQRLAAGMNKRDMHYLMGVSFGLNALWPLITHYLPQLALNPYFSVPMCAAFVGLFFAGHYVHRMVTLDTAGKRRTCLAVIAGAILLSVLLTHVEYTRVEPGAKYWFMDERTVPSLFTIIAAIALMAYAKAKEQHNHKPANTRFRRLAFELGACTFGVYLLQDWIIAQTHDQLFLPLGGAIPVMLAVILWEVVVFLIALCVAWVLRKIPLLRRML